ncbi:MAG: hypothetical protein CME36_19550 [unclassified Hahellaceae]|nr:hypothetical protein [Hahellaceae bacterium]|tara:strand:+ start:13701 stop:14174 length:474 start_codon:yes stop_codon:yes gene_type:complete
MSNQAVNIQSLLDLLRSDIASLQQLHRLLRFERTFLEQGELEKFKLAGEKKITCLEQIERNAGLKTSWLKANNLTIEKFRQLARERVPKAFELLTEAEDLLKAVSSLNRVNQKIIQLSQQRVERIMDVLRGKTAAPSLYGAAARSAAAGHGRAIASA